MFSTLYSIIKGELRTVVEQKMIAAIFVGTIIIYGLYYPQPFTTQVLRNVPMAVVDLDNSDSTRQIIRDLDASPSADVVLKLPDVVAAKRAIFERKISAYLYFPEEFERNLLGGQQSPVAFYGDASFFLTYSEAQSAVTGAVQKTALAATVVRLTEQGMTGAQAQAVAAPITLNMISVYNPEKGYATYVIPAVFLVILQQILLMGVGFLNTVDRSDEDVLEVHPVIKTIGKLLAYSVPAVFLYFMATIVIPNLYGVPRIGGVWQGFAIAVPYALSISALALIIAEIFKKPLAVQVACNCLGMPFFFMAGAPWPRDVMPDAFRLVTKLVPSSTGVEATVRVNQMGANLYDIQNQLTILWGLSLLYFLLAVLFVRQRDKRLAADRRKQSGERKSPDKFGSAPDSA